MNDALVKKIDDMIDQKTKPPGSLGMIEAIARKVCLIQETLSPQLKNPHILIFAGDHGIAQSGVSAYPSEVTAQMVHNFVKGGAAINVFCRQHQIELRVVDAGVNTDFDYNLPIRHDKVAKGTQNFLNQPAMSTQQLEVSLKQGAQHIQSLSEMGCNIIGLGEMGIGNTSAAAMVMHKLLDLPLEVCVGQGTGVVNRKYDHKLAILKRATITHLEVKGVEGVMQTFAGFEMAMMCGAYLEAAQQKMIIMVDGFIASAAFLCAVRINPEVMDYALFCHQSDEKGHALLLERLGVKPILQLAMRLGEGTGCAIAYPIVESAVRFIHEMASFESAKVSGME